MGALCSCKSEALCPTCYDRLRFQVAGSANARGAWWAKSVAAKVSVHQPWPAFDGKCAAIARSKAHDLSSDPRLREEFAYVIYQAAVSTWETLRRTASS